MLDVLGAAYFRGREGKSEIADSGGSGPTGLRGAVPRDRGAKADCREVKKEKRA